VPWVPDGLRDRPDRRPEMHALFESVLREAAATYAVLSGSVETRLDAARRQIDALIS
jgi:HTH-type transcriptional regulator, transcriptional repressor of NAD biosynthesis genes